MADINADMDAGGRRAGERERRKRAIAVALAWTPGAAAGDAPKVVATGQGEMAERILALAFENGVKVREDPDLAELLVAVEVDSVIPLEAFSAVAEILAYVYRANHRLPPQTPTERETD